VIRHLDEFDAEELLVVPYMRASTWEQRKKRNLLNRLKLLKLTLDRRGIKRVKAFGEVTNGRFVNTGRPKLAAAIEAARALQGKRAHNTVIVVTDARNRFIRGPQYNGQTETDPPSHRQLKRLAKLAKGVPLATVLHPDALFSTVRGYETNVPTALGEKSGKKVGRPTKPPTPVRCPGRKKQIRLKKIDKARRLHDEGKSKREIGQILHVPESTMRAWLKREQT
jgi:hypothetical protein